MRVAEPIFLSDEKITAHPVRLFQGEADDYVPVTPCRDFAKRLQRLGKDVTMTIYSNARHGFDNPLFPAVRPLPNAEVSTRCRREQRAHDVIFNLDTGKPFSSSDACVTRGATCASRCRGSGHREKYSMNRASLVVVTVLGLIGMPSAHAQMDGRALRLQQQVLGVDAHNDTVQRLLYLGADLGQRSPSGPVDLPRLREGGMHVPFFALWVPMYYKGSEAIRRTLDLRDKMQEVFDKYPDRIGLATSADDIQRLVGKGAIAAVLTIEGGHQIADDLAVLRMYRRLGILSMTLTHFRGNNWADSATAAPEHNGLTDFGYSVVREMNRIGMIVDVSHVSDKTFYDSIAVSTKPVIASHSSCRALVDFPRNMSDDMLRALAINGGVVGVNFASGYLNQQDAELGRQRIAARNKQEPDLTGSALDEYARKDWVDSGYGTPGAGTATVDDAVACIDHVVKVAGIDHVGIGSDFDGITLAPQGLEDESKMPALTAALMRKGYSDRDIRKIMGENFLRVVRQVVGH